MHKVVMIGLLLGCGTAHTESIPLVREHGTLLVPVLINDKITLNDRTPGILVTPLAGSAIQSQITEDAVHQTLAEKVAAEDRADQESRMGIHHHSTIDIIDWTKLLDPLAGAGWIFRYTGVDKSWALFTSNRENWRTGQIVSLWLRWEQDRQQINPSGVAFLSYVENVEYDCMNERVRTLTQFTYPENNTHGNAQTIEVDPKMARWRPIVPGTQGEDNFHIACSDR